MTRNRGQKLPTAKSANKSIDEAAPVTKDGPEGYHEDASNRQFEDDTTKASYAKSTKTLSKSKAENYGERDTVTGNLESGRRSITGSPRTTEKILALKASRFGSPFAYVSCQSRDDFFKGLLGESTSVLFDRVVTETSTLRDRLSPGFALTSDGSNGQFCFLKKCNSPNIDPESSEESKSNDSQLELLCFEPSTDRLKLPVFVDPPSAAVPRISVSRNHPIDSIDFSDYPSTNRKGSKAENSMDVHRVPNSDTGDVEYFVVNQSVEFLSINGIDVDPTVRAGPLPDFAVLELGQFSIFWWRTAAALDYMPGFKRKRGCQDEEEGLSRKAFKGDLDPSPNPPVSPDSKRWLDEYRRRLQLCIERPIKYTSSVSDSHPPHRLPELEDELRDIDVILAIGAVWLGLVHAQVDFAYADSNLFSFARSTRMVGMHAVKGSNPFVMPLVFNTELGSLSPESEEDRAEPSKPVFSAYQRGEEEKNQENFAAAEKAKQKNPGNKNRRPPKDQEIQTRNYIGGIGHFMLAIAEKVNRDGPNVVKEVLAKRAPVRLRFMDSLDGNTDKGEIRRVARNIVRNSGWLGDTWPCFDAKEEHWTKVLRQSENGNRCGEHTILNAWAYMLGIPLATTRKGTLAKKSYDQVRLMIHLALQGQLDSLTITAWMQNFGYAVNEPLSQLQQAQIQDPGLPNRLGNIRTVALNEYAFNEIISDMHKQEQATNQEQAINWGAVTLPPNLVTALQPGHAPKFATEVALPLVSQGSVADVSGTSGVSGTSIGSAETPQLPQASPSFPNTWRNSLEQGLAYHEALRATNPRTTNDTLKDATKIKSSSNMADYEVVLGIAPIWEGLKRLGRADFDFTYAGLDVFAPLPQETGPQGVGPVGRLTRFIMPLFFSPKQAEAIATGKGNMQGVGHFLLCVAELVDNEPKTLQVQVFDSRVGTVDSRLIVQKAKEIIGSCGWLGDTKPEQVVFRPFIRTPVPGQVGINACGLHVIFNAWAVMLDIPIHPQSRRKPSKGNEKYATDDEFLELGLKIVNLALEGFMNSTTIQAFFNVFGYSVEQRCGDPARAVIPVNAVGMNMDKLGHTLETRHWGTLIASSEYYERKFEDADMAYLHEQGLSKDQAWRALTIANGNRVLALHWHYERDPFGELPKPEDALSPKTPDRGKKS